MQVSASLFNAFTALRQRFSQRLDSEHEQAFVRLVIGVLLGSYFSYFTLYGVSNNQKWHLISLGVMAGFIAISTLLIIFIALYPGVSPFRRLIGATVDVGTTTYFSFTATEFAAPLYCLYLWIIIGHGFRFGNRYLFFALALSMVGFGAAVFMLPYWSSSPALGIGLWAGMLLVSMYISTLVGRLTTALEYAEAANRAKRRFISSVSHELRTPLNAIIGMADLLHGTKLDKEQEDMLRSLDNASHLMLSLIEDVLDFSKIEAGKLVIENTDFDLYKLIYGIVDIFKYQAATRGLDLQVNINPDVSYALRGDPHHISQVLVNLLANAVKFTEEGRIVLRIKVLADTEQSSTLLFEVQDTGIGIELEAQSKVFDSFTQADETTTRRYGGTGLGTTICKQLVELMGGRLGLQSQVGVGSTFWFELNLKKQSVAASNEKNFESLRMLLVGLNKTHAAAIDKILETSDIHYQHAADIDAAIAKMAEASLSCNPYKLVLLEKLSPLSETNGVIEESPVIFVQKMMAKLRASTDTKFSVVLCTNDTSLDENQYLVEMANVFATLALPIEKRFLFNVLHRINTSVIDSNASTKPVVSSLALDADSSQNHLMHRDGYSVLVAEDNLTNQKVIQKILERAGHLCTIVNNGEEALDQLGQQDFDAIVLDMNMPIMSGLEAAKAYRFMRPAEMRAPVIMFSADVTNEAKEECLNAGVDKFLPKPIQVASFLEELRYLVEQSGPAQRIRVPHRIPDNFPILAQPPGDEIILNYATLAELERIGQDRMFVDGLLEGFIKDNNKLMERMEGAILLLKFEEFKEILHAIKGSSASIGAVSLRMTCHQLEKLTHGELKSDTRAVLDAVRNAFNKLCAAIEHYRKQRNQLAPYRH
jgi:two-component system sensor histidine kinase RpfC